jgi:hypothetical protein
MRKQSVGCNSVCYCPSEELSYRVGYKHCDPNKCDLHRLLVESQGILSQLFQSEADVEEGPGHRL